jgi:hypothetical protein
MTNFVHAAVLQEKRRIGSNFLFIRDPGRLHCPVFICEQPASIESCGVEETLIQLLRVHVRESLGHETGTRIEEYLQWQAKFTNCCIQKSEVLCSM